MLKKCTKCGEEKPATREYFYKKLKGLSSHCKLCRQREDKICYEENRNYILSQKRKYWLTNRELLNKKRRNSLSPSHSKGYRTKYNKGYWQKTKEQQTLRHKRWLQRPEVRMRRREKQEKMRKNNPQCRLNNNISTIIRRSIYGKKAGRKWESLVGYTLEDLMKHFEKQFTKDMTWENMGQWHIDHIIPISAFNFSAPEHIDFKRCWALENLRPLWAKENISKSNKILKPFQPSLGL